MTGMQLLLLEDVRRLGHVGDVVEVAPGYARNYLLPQRLATEPTAENIAAIEDRKKAAAAERAMRMKQYEELVERMQEVSVTIEAAANPEGTLYGSVGEKDIAQALNEQGFPIEPDHVILDAHIRTLDNRAVTIEFTDEISAEIKVWVVREGGALDVDESGESESEPDSGFDAESESDDIEHDEDA
jgi:large subunit ribosomal protein L9